MRRLAVLTVALLLIAWKSSPRKIVAAQPSSLSLPPPPDEQDDDPPTRGLPPPQEDDDPPPMHSLPPPPDEQDDDPPTPRLPLSPPTPGESDAPESSLPNSPPPPEPETLAPTAPPHPRHAQLPPRQDDPPEPEPSEPPHQRQAPSPPREPMPPRTVVPPQEPGWAAVPLPLPPTPAPPRVLNYTATGCTTMLVFGDSTVDPGNNNRLPTAMKANFLPYGTSFLGGRPTGRFSNGRLITDILAEKLGIARSIPGFHEPRLRPRQLRRGVSFASAGSGYDDATARISVMRTLGGRRFVFVGVPPVGCLPIVRTLLGTGAEKCHENMYLLATSFNKKLVDVVCLLKNERDTRATLIDIYPIIGMATVDPKTFGLTETSRGCCGTGVIEVGQICRGRRTCTDPSKYMYWDAVHQTERMNQIISDHVIMNSIGEIYV